MAAESSSSDPPAPDRVEREQELLLLRAELEEYQDLLDALPGIYEVKFSSQLRDLAQDIQRLSDERRALQQQINHCLHGAEDLALPPAARLTVVRRWLRRWPRWRLLLLSTAGAVVALGVGALLLRGLPLQRRPAAMPAPAPARSTSAPVPPAVPQPAQPQLRLRAQGEVWLEVRSADNSLVFVSTLRPGQTHSFPLTDGLRIRSGRPHLLEVALAEQPFAPLGAANDFSWHTITVKASGQIPVLKPEVSVQSS